MPSEVALISIVGGVLSLFESIFVLSGHSYPLHEGHCLTCMWLGCLAKFFLCDSPCQLYCIGSMDAKEDDQDFRFLDSTIYPLESVMFLLWTQNLVLFQKIVVPLPWRLFLGSPKTGRTKQFGGIFLFLMQRHKKIYNTGNQSLGLFELICDYPYFLLYVYMFLSVTRCYVTLLFLCIFAPPACRG